MIGYKEAHKIASEVFKGIGIVSGYEYQGAFAFFPDTGDEATDGGIGPVIILKEDGRALNFVDYAIKHGDDFMRRFTIDANGNPVDIPMESEE